MNFVAHGATLLSFVGVQLTDQRSLTANKRGIVNIVLPPPRLVGFLAICSDELVQSWKSDELSGPARGQLAHLRRKPQHFPSEQDRRGESVPTLWQDRG